MVIVGAAMARQTNVQDRNHKVESFSLQNHEIESKLLNIRHAHMNCTHSNGNWSHTVLRSGNLRLLSEIKLVSSVVRI